MEEASVSTGPVFPASYILEYLTTTLPAGQLQVAVDDVLVPQFRAVIRAALTGHPVRVNAVAVLELNSIGAGESRC